MKDVFERAFKTFIETLIPSVLAQTAAISSGVVNYGWNDWQSWLLPLLVPCVATAFSAAWNSIQNGINKKNSEENK